MRMSDIDRRFVEIEKRLISLENNQETSTQKDEVKNPKDSWSGSPDPSKEPAFSEEGYTQGDPTHEDGDSMSLEIQPLDSPNENPIVSEGDKIPKKRGRPKKEVKESDSDIGPEV